MNTNFGQHASAAGKASVASRPLCACGSRTAHDSDQCWPCWSASQTCPTCGREERKMARRDMCHGCYKAHRKRTGSLPPFRPRPAPEDALWARVDRSGGPDACWPWTGPVTRNGYGYAPKGLDEKTTHRAAYRLAFGAPGDLHVMHSCDNPPCCNPKHLSLGTTQDNTADRHSKGRDAKGDRHGAKTDPSRLSRGDSHYSRQRPDRLARGERHGSKIRPESVARGSRCGTAVLTEADVHSIRAALADGKSKLSLAKRYGVAHATIRNIAAGKTWGHLHAAPPNENSGD